MRNVRNRVVALRTRDNASIFSALVRCAAFAFLGILCLVSVKVAGPILPFLATTALFVFLILSKSPKLAVIFWLLTVAFLPFWFGIEVGAYIAPASAAALLVIASIGKWPPFKLNVIDFSVLGLMFVCVFSGLMGLSRIGDVSTVVTQWLLGYLVARLLAARAGYDFVLKTVLIILSFVAGLSVVEFVAGWNPYIGLAIDNDYYRVFGRLQERGGIVRAEWAFGHSIALGHALVLALPIAIGSTLSKNVKFITVVVLLAGVFVTFSRGAQVSAVFAVILAVLFIRGISIAQRALITSGLMLAAIIAIPQIESVLDNSGPEATHSVDYRKDLLSLVPSMRWLGLASNANESTANVVEFGDFGSIDSTFLFLGLRFGLIAVIVAVVVCILAIITVGRSRAPLPLISIVAIMPGLLTASLITQYGMLVWFFVGLSAAGVTSSKSPVEHMRPLIDSRNHVGH